MACPPATSTVTPGRATARSARSTSRTNARAGADSKALPRGWAMMRRARPSSATNTPPGASPTPGTSSGGRSHGTCARRSGSRASHACTSLVAGRSEQELARLRQSRAHSLGRDDRGQLRAGLGAGERPGERGVLRLARRPAAASGRARAGPRARATSAVDEPVGDRGDVLRARTPDQKRRELTAAERAAPRRERRGVAASRQERRDVGRDPEVTGGEPRARDGRGDEGDAKPRPPRHGSAPGLSPSTADGAFRSSMRMRVTRRRLSAVISAVASRASATLSPARGRRPSSSTTKAPTGSPRRVVRHHDADGAQLFHRRAASTSHVRSLAGDLHDLRRLLVELVADLADDLLEQVLHRHDAARAAVLVDHDGDGRLLALHLAHHVDAALDLGHEEDVAPQGRQVRQRARHRRGAGSPSRRGSPRPRRASGRSSGGCARTGARGRRRTLRRPRSGWAGTSRRRAEPSRGARRAARSA